MENNIEEQIKFIERKNTKTSWTKNEEFDANGYLVIKNICDPQSLVDSLPILRGRLSYWGKDATQFHHEPVEDQVAGSVSRYGHPQYKKIHTSLRCKLEKILGRKLYNTYYYDRFYFPGQELKKHIDRDACEISVTIHVGTNLKKEDANWPIWIKTPDVYKDEKQNTILVPGQHRSLLLAPGDGMIYKGCERPHWRDPLPIPETKKKTKEELYYHQVFFHYVLQDGQRAHCAFDAAR